MLCLTLYISMAMFCNLLFNNVGKLAKLNSCHSIPGAPLTNFNDRGGSDRGSYFIPKKITTSEFVYPKKSQLQNLSSQKNHYFS